MKKGMLANQGPRNHCCRQPSQLAVSDQRALQEKAYQCEDLQRDLGQQPAPPWYKKRALPVHHQSVSTDHANPHLNDLSQQQKLLPLLNHR